MCVATPAHHISYNPQQQHDSEYWEEPREFPSPKRRLFMAEFLRHGRFLTVSILMVAYLGQQANESRRLTKLHEMLLRNAEPIVLQSWWVVVYALIAYLMFGSSRRWLVQRDIARISKATSQAFQQVASTDALHKIRSSVSMRSIQLFGNGCPQHDDEHCGKRTLTLSVDKPFLAESQIAKMTLRDIKDVFQYVFECDTDGFDRDAFVAKLRGPARQAIESLFTVALPLSRSSAVTSAARAGDAVSKAATSSDRTEPPVPAG